MTPPEAVPHEWLSRARDDLKVARLLLMQSDFPTWPAGFHLQQAAEKALKAILVARGEPAPRTHDLEQLAQSAARYHAALGEWRDRLAPLLEFGVAHRYPGLPEPEIDLQAATTAVADLLALAAQII